MRLLDIDNLLTRGYYVLDLAGVLTQFIECFLLV
ncbi:hypothetical protein VISP3789_13345 [Vibrio splendidus ATCC 33789]|nr:hypothetical protein VISP3789_13345 [Vibrio splendidus ATCC 33789]